MVHLYYEFASPSERLMVDRKNVFTVDNGAFVS
jgi:hypothetical protein